MAEQVTTDFRDRLTVLRTLMGVTLAEMAVMCGLEYKRYTNLIYKLAHANELDVERVYLTWPALGPWLTAQQEIDIDALAASDDPRLQRVVTQLRLGNVPPGFDLERYGSVL